MNISYGALLVRFLPLLLLFLPITLTAQKKTNEIEVLVLTSTKSNKVVKIKSAKRLRIWLSDEVSVKGRLVELKPDTIVIDNQLIAINQIKRIRIGSTGTKIVGGAIIGGGILVAGLGIGVILNASSAGGCLGPITNVLAGLVVSGTGTMISFVGVPVFLMGKKFDLEKNWKISTATLVDK